MWGKRLPVLHNSQVFMQFNINVPDSPFRFNYFLHNSYLSASVSVFLLVLQCLPIVRFRAAPLGKWCLFVWAGVVKLI